MDKPGLLDQPGAEVAWALASKRHGDQGDEGQTWESWWKKFEGYHSCNLLIIGEEMKQYTGRGAVYKEEKKKLKRQPGHELASYAITQCETTRWWNRTEQSARFWYKLNKKGKSGTPQAKQVER